MVETNSYDEVPYTSHPYRQTHPDRLATIATLHGLNSPPPENCRVLEIACASGGNLIPMAEQLPNSKFLGVDFSKREIDEGCQVIAALGLSNVELRHANILEIGPELGEFDYIIAHGVYSWVNQEVRTKLLDVCRQNLSPRGVAYVSYNTYPGWHMRAMIRDMMCYRGRSFSNPADRVRQARGFLNFLSQSVPADNNAYGMLLKSEINLIRDKRDDYLLHDHLEDINDPIYFFQFIEAAEKLGMRYLGDADSRVSLRLFSPNVQAMLQTVASDDIEMEQYADFLRNRMFRQSLLCHANVLTERLPSPDNVGGLYVASPARLEDGPQNAGTPQQLTFTVGRSSTSTADPLLKAAMQYLIKLWPESVPFANLVATVSSQRGTAPAVIDSERVTQLARRIAAPLLEWYAVGLVDFSVRPISFATSVPDRPSTTQLVRFQADANGTVTNLRHETVGVTDLQRHILKLLDGTRDRSSLLTLIDLSQQNRIVVRDQGNPVDDPNRLETILADAIDKDLQELARTGLLMA